jgi:UDP-glucose 4-epimerase
VSGKVITVTGGKGFIGAHVARYAEAAGHQVRFFDRRQGWDIMGDLAHIDTGLRGSDAVIHLAGVLGTLELFEQIPEAIDSNIRGSYNIQRWCSLNGVQYTGILVPPVFPSIYCATKEASRAIATALYEAGRLKVSHVIAYNAFGPGQAYGPGHPRKFGPTFSIAALNAKPIPIWGDGKNLIDPTPVEVVARMLVDATEHSDNAIFDGGIGIAVTVTEVAELVAAYAAECRREAGVPFVEGPLIAYEPMRIGETPTNVAATGRGWDRLDWDPRDYQATWRDALRETVRSYVGVPYDAEFVSGLDPR